MTDELPPPPDPASRQDADAKPGTAAEASLDRLNRFWYVKLPARIDPWLPGTADALHDGVWTADITPVGALLPVAGFVVGFFAHPVFPGVTNVWSESLLFILVAVGISILSRTAGIMLLLGYIVGDLLFGPDFFVFAGTFQRLAKVYGGKLVSYLLLAIPTVFSPLMARKWTVQLARRIPGIDPTRTALRAGIYAAGCGVLAWFWAQGTIVLIRPLFVWVDQSPTVEAVSQVQTRGTTIILTTVIAAIARVFLDEFFVPKSGSVTVVNALRAEREETDERQGEFWDKVPQPATIVGTAGLVTLLLGGTYTSWVDAAIVAAAALALGALRIGLIPGLPKAYRDQVERIPSMFRFLAAFFVGLIVSQTIVGQMFESGSLRPVMIGAIVTFVLFYALFPSQQRSVTPAADSVAPQMAPPPSPNPAAANP